MLATAAFLALLMAGCGSRARLSKADYQQKVSELGPRLSATLEGVFSSPALQNPSLEEAADIARRGADLIQRAADELGSISPPAEAQGAHERLVDGLEGLATGLEAFADDVAHNDQAQIGEFLGLVESGRLPSMVTIQGAINELRSQGYNVGS